MYNLHNVLESAWVSLELPELQPVSSELDKSVQADLSYLRFRIDLALQLVVHSCLLAYRIKAFLPKQPEPTQKHRLT